MQQFDAYSNLSKSFPPNFQIDIRTHSKEFRIRVRCPVALLVYDSIRFLSLLNNSPFVIVLHSIDEIMPIIRAHLHSILISLPSFLLVNRQFFSISHAVILHQTLSLLVRLGLHSKQGKETINEGFCNRHCTCLMPTQIPLNRRCTRKLLASDQH